jgi:hypothetical protein
MKESSKLHIGTCPGNVGRCGTPLTRLEQYADPRPGVLGPGAVYVAPGTLCARCRKSYEKDDGRVYEGASDGDLILALRAELARARGVIGELSENLRVERAARWDLEVKLHDRDAEFMP